MPSPPSPSILTYRSKIAPVQVAVTNQIRNSVVATTVGSSAPVSTSFLLTSEWNSVAALTNVQFSFQMTRIDANTVYVSIAPISITLQPANAVYTLMYSSPNSTLEAGEVLVEYSTRGQWNINITPCSYFSLGKTVNGFGCGLMSLLTDGPTYKQYPLADNVQFIMQAQGGSVILGTRFQASTTKQTFYFKYYAQTGARMLCDGATGKVVTAYAGINPNLSTPTFSLMDETAWLAKYTANPSQECWYVVPSSLKPVAVGMTYVLLMYFNTQCQQLVIQLSATNTNTSPRRNQVVYTTVPGYGSYVASSNTALSAMVLLVQNSCPRGCSMLTNVQCPNGNIDCSTSVTPTGIVACASCATGGGVPGVADPAAKNCIIFTSYMVAGSVTVVPGYHVLYPMTSFTYFNITYPFSLTLTFDVGAVCNVPLEVDTTIISVSAGMDIVPVNYSRTCGYEFKTYCQLVTQFDSVNNVARVSVRPYAPLTNGFVENSFGTPGAGYTSQQQGFYYGNKYSLVPLAPFLVGNNWTPSTDDVNNLYTFATVASTKRQIIAKAALSVLTGDFSRQSVQLTFTYPLNYDPASFEGCMQFFQPGQAVTNNVFLKYKPKSGILYTVNANADTAYSSTWASVDGVVFFDNPPGFATGSVPNPVQFLLYVNLYSSILNWGNIFVPYTVQSNVCWAQNLYGCPGDAPTCRFGDTEAGSLFCSSVGPPTDFIPSVCASTTLLQDSSVGCRAVAGVGALECTGWNSDSFGAACREACAWSTANGLSCDSAMKTVCDANVDLPDCACMNVKTSTVRVPVKNDYSYPQYDCFLSTKFAKEIGTSNLDYMPQCWWPTCNVDGGGYVTSSMLNPEQRAKTCPVAVSECFNLISNIDALSSAFSVQAVNKTSSQGGCAGALSPDTAKTPIECINSSFPSNKYQKPLPPPPVVPQKPGNTSQSLERYFKGGYNNQSTKLFAKRAAITPKYFNKYCGIAVGVAAFLGLILIVVLFAASAKVYMKQNAE